MNKMSYVFFIVLSIIVMKNSFADDRVINLFVDYKTVHFAGQYKKAMAINNQIPAPILHFKEGDHVSINVFNHLNEETAIHWHGMLVPWQMDGVLGISQQGIQPGQSFHYEFTLHQSGTYWYHAHAGLQEQQGLYGAFIIDPKIQPSYHYTKDYTIVLSDWSNTDPNQILANLKKEGDYYSPRFPLQPSLAKFIYDYKKSDPAERKKLMADYKMMQQMRMSIYDFSDVAFDAFLLNGQPKNAPWKGLVKTGDVVRLRFIGAAGSTIFHVKIPGTMMQMVHIEGNDVEPYMINDFKIAPGETYDVLVKIEKNLPYIIYAESADTLGAAYGALVTSPDAFVNFKAVTPFPEPLPVTREMMDNMMMSDMPMNHDMGNMDKSANHNHAIQQVEQKKNISSNNDTVKNKQNTNAIAPVVNEKNNQHTQNMSGMDMTMDRAKPSIHSMSANHMTMDHSKKLDHKIVMHKHTMTMDHAMDMPIEPTIIGDSITSPVTQNDEMTTPGTKYENLTAAIATNNPNTPIKGVIRMELFGYMDRFIWFINGVPEYLTKPIILEPGQRYRIIFTNTSMMHHPMHMHGHWFILRKGLGSYDPLLHTIDVAPGATMIADVDTDASGQWFFHCHLLYHMIAGMSRNFQYSTLLEIIKDERKPQNIVKDTQYYNRPIVRVDEIIPIDTHLVKHPMAHPMGLNFANFLDVSINPFTNVQKFTFKGLYGSDYNKLELLTEDAEMNKGKVENADIDIFYWRLISQFWAVKGGVNYFNRPANSPYWQPGVGVEGLLPYFIDADIRSYFYGGSLKIDAEFLRDTQLTNNFFMRLGIRSILASKTVTAAQIGSGLNQMRYIVHPYYRIAPGLDIFLEYEYEKDYGAFRDLQVTSGDSPSEGTITLGFSFVF